MNRKQENMMKAVWRRGAMGCAVWAVAMSASWAQQIQSISVQPHVGGDTLRVELSEPLKMPAGGFAVQSPPRVAIDLPGVSNALGRNTVDFDQGQIRSVVVAQAADKTRLVLNLRQAGGFSTSADGRVLFVKVDATPSSVATNRFAEPLNSQAQSLQGVDFRRSPEGGGRIIVALPSNQVGVDIQESAQGLTVEFLRSAVPQSLRRRLDVVDFATPVQTITTTQHGDKVRMQIQNKGAWTHSAYQSDQQFVIDVRPKSAVTASAGGSGSGAPRSALTGQTGYRGEKLSLNFQNIEVRALLQVIADFTNFNVVASDSVNGNVTLRLKDVPWDQALDIILQSRGLGMKKNGNVIWVAPKEEIAARDRADMESKTQITALEPTRTQAFQLNYAKAADVAAALQAGGEGKGRTLSERGAVVYEARTNQLFVTDVPSKLEDVQALIARIDVAVRQVMIEARIVEATDSFGRTLGVKLGANHKGSYNVNGLLDGSANKNLAVGGTWDDVLGNSGQNSTNEVDNPFVSLPAAGQNGFGAASIALSLFGRGAARFLNLELSALEADGKGKIVSSPRVVTADKIKALIEQGTELPYQAATSSGATSVEFKKANLKLEVTPQITPEGSVILDVDVNKDSVGQATASGVAINTKHVKTQVLVENGGTVVIGGIFEQIDREDITKVPLLGDIPYIGNLFKNRNKSSSRVELLIFLTPRVITDASIMQ